MAKSMAQNEMDDQYFDQEIEEEDKSFQEIA